MSEVKLKADEKKLFDLVSNVNYPGFNVEKESLKICIHWRECDDEFCQAVKKSVACCGSLKGCYHKEYFELKQ